MDPKTVAGWYDFQGRTVALTGGAGVLSGEVAVALPQHPKGIKAGLPWNSTKLY